MMKNKINRLVAASALLLLSGGAYAQQQAGNKKAVPGKAQEIAIPAPPSQQINTPAEQLKPSVPAENYKPADTDKLVRPDIKKHNAENIPPALIPVAPSDSPALVSKNTDTGPSGLQKSKPVAANPIKEQ